LALINLSLLTPQVLLILKKYKPGDSVLVSDHVNFYGQSPLCGRETPFSKAFTDLSKVQNICLQEIFKKVAKSEKIKIKHGAIYGLTKMAKEFETPAEVRMFKKLGIDLLGMSSVLESIACVNMGIDTAMLSVVTNEASGLGPSVSHEENLKIVENLW
jgi:purine-nucleoside phosphorylase